MERMRMESADMAARNIEKLGELFPNCVTETADGNGGLRRAINVEKLKEMCGGGYLKKAR